MAVLSRAIILFSQARQVINLKHILYSQPVMSNTILLDILHTRKALQKSGSDKILDKVVL